MDVRLTPLIDDYKAAVARAVAELVKSGISRPATTTDWVGNDVPGRGKLFNGGDYLKHGFGCVVRMPGTTVDFDFGDDGQIDGFDWSRLALFAGSNLQRRYGIRDKEELRNLVDAALDAGDLTHSGYILCYTRDSVVNAPNGG